eukprot:m.152710 g.152710  ORF g.152710 m.152710 type:complete len:103 (-) comp16218_c1_seq1:1675-1983(-)
MDLTLCLLYLTVYLYLFDWLFVLAGCWLVASPLNFLIGCLFGRFFIYLSDWLLVGCFSIDLYSSLFVWLLLHLFICLVACLVASSFGSSSFLVPPVFLQFNE